MSGKAKGTVAQLRSDTVLFGHIAFRLEGLGHDQLDAWADELKIHPRGEALRRKPEASARLEGGPDVEAVIRPWLLLDWQELNFFMAMVKVHVERPSDQLDQLEEVPGVIDLFACDGSAELIALVVYERRRDKESLHLRLSEFGQVASWNEVSDHRPTAAISTLRGLTSEAANREQMLKGK